MPPVRRQGARARASRVCACGHARSQTLQRRVCGARRASRGRKRDAGENKQTQDLGAVFGLSSLKEISTLEAGLRSASSCQPLLWQSRHNTNRHSFG